MACVGDFLNSPALVPVTLGLLHLTCGLHETEDKAACELCELRERTKTGRMREVRCKQASIAQRYQKEAVFDRFYISLMLGVIVWIFAQMHITLLSWGLTFPSALFFGLFLFHTMRNQDQLLNNRRRHVPPTLLKVAERVGPPNVGCNDIHHTERITPTKS